MESAGECNASHGKMCRLCAGASSEGYELFTTNSREKDELVKYICSMLYKKYLPISEKDETKKNQLKWLCKGCYAEASKTKEFMQCVEIGQLKLQEQWLASGRAKKQEMKQKESLESNKRRIKMVNRKNETVSREDDEAVAINHKRDKPEPTTFASRFGFSKSLKNITPEIVYHKANLETHLITPPLAEVRSVDDTLLGEIIESKTTFNEDTTVTKQIYYLCEYCRAAFIKSKEFLKHVGTHTNCLYECRQCLEKFKQKENFSKHQKQSGHEGIGLIENINTEENSTEVNDLMPDKNATTEGIINCLEANSLKFVCKECQKEFKSLQVLRSHYRGVHVGQRIFKCNFCAAKFKTKYNCDLHLATHTGEKRYHCKTCPKSFKTNYECKRHNRIHTGEKPYNCSVCNKKFKFRCNLITHKRLHTGERPYKCNLCEASFITASSLKKHRNIHLKKSLKNTPTDTQTQISGSRKTLTTTRTESVKQISKPASRSLLKSCNIRPSKLTKTKTSQCSINIEKVEVLPPMAIPETAIITSKDEHMQFLNDEIPTISSSSISYKFVCTVCQKKFKQSSALRKHQRTHTGERPYKCPMCPKSFSDPSNFKKHKNLHKNATHALEEAAQLNTATMQELRQMLAEQSVEILSDKEGSISDPDPDRLETFSYTNKQKSFSLSPSGSEFDDDDDDGIENQRNRKAREILMALKSLKRSSDSLIIDDSLAILDGEDSTEKQSPIINDDTNKQVVPLSFKKPRGTKSYDIVKSRLLN